MSNLNKTSVRTEFIRLKADFEKLCAGGTFRGSGRGGMAVESLLAMKSILPHQMPCHPTSLTYWRKRIGLVKQDASGCYR